MNKTKVNTVVDMLIFILMLSLFFSSGKVHETTAYILGGCIVFHIAMHWAQFKVMYRKLLPDLKAQVVIGILVAVLAVASIVLLGGQGHEGMRGRGPGYGYHQTLNADQD